MAGVFNGSSAARVAWAPYTDLVASFALSIWIKPTTNAGVPFQVGRFNSGYYTFLSTEGGPPTVTSRNGGTNYTFAHPSNALLGTWNHVFIHWVPNGAISIWLNGVKATGTLLGCPFVTAGGLNNTQLGSFNSSVGFFPGSVYDTVLWKGLALPTTTNITNIQTGTDPVTELGAPEARWGMSGSGTLLTDSVGGHNLANFIGAVTYADDAPVFGTVVEIAPVGANTSAASVGTEITRRLAPMAFGESAGTVSAEITRPISVVGANVSVGSIASPSAGTVNISVVGANLSIASISAKVVAFGENYVAEPFLDDSYFDDGMGFLNDFDIGNVWITTEAISIRIGDDGVSGYIRVPAGAGKQLLFNIVDDNGNAINLSAARAEWVLAQQLGDPAVLQKTENNGISFPEVGVLVVSISPTDTIGLSGQYTHELNIEIGGQTKPEFVGIFEVAPSTAGLMG